MLRDRHNGIDVEVYYHPPHSMNAPRILKAAVVSLQTFEKSFGPYHYRLLRIVEVPSYWRMGGFATANVVFLNENRSFLIDGRNARRPDLLLRRVAHEVGHLWWGYQLSPRNTEGASAIVESLAKYSELEIVRSIRGREHVRSLLEMELDRYLKGRSDESHREPPLYKVSSQPYVYYSKGAIVLNAIRDLLGQEAMNKALTNFMMEHGGPAGAATSLDLFSNVVRLTNGEQSKLIEEWTKEIVIYDLKMESAGVKKLGQGKYEVEMTIYAGKAKADGQGNLTPLPFQPELLDVAAFITEPDIEEETENILYLQKHLIHQGKNVLSIVVNKYPGFVAVDPYLHRIDENRFDQIKRAPTLQTN